MQLLLNNQELLDLGDDLRAVEIQFRTGCCWLTQAGDSRDRILHAGQSHTVTRRGKVLVMALTESRLELIAPPIKKQRALLVAGSLRVASESVR